MTAGLPAPQADASESSITAIDRFLESIITAVGGSSWGEALRFHDIDLLETARSPLFVELLAAARSPGRHAPRASRISWRDRLRRYAVDRQLPGPLLEWRSRRRSQRPPHDAFLLWPREPTHVATMLPVARELAGSDGSSPSTGFVVCQPRLFDRLRPGTEDAAVRDVTLTRAEWPDLVRRVEASAAPILDQLQEPIDSYLPQSSELGLTAGRIDDLLRSVMSRQLPTLLETIFATERIADELAPRALVLGNDLTIEGRAAARVARASGVPTASLMHGAITADPLQRHHVVDRFLVYGDRSRDELIALGLEASRLVVTGNPRLDERPAPSRETDPRVAALGAVADGQPWLLVASSGPGHRTSLEHHRRFIEALDVLAEALPGVRIVAKLHRKDRRDHYPDDPRYAIVPHDAPGAPRDIFTWLRGPRALITGASTVAIEAMLVDIPVVTVDLAGDLGEVDFIAAGATLHSTDVGRLVDNVRRLLESEQRQDEAEVRSFIESTFANVGRAAVAAADTVRQLGSAS